MVRGDTEVLGNYDRKLEDGVEGIVLRKGRDVGRCGESGEMVVV